MKKVASIQLSIERATQTKDEVQYRKLIIHDY